MALSTWWRGDPMPELAPLAGFRGVVSHDVAQVTALTALDAAEVNARFDAGHRVYIGMLDDEPVAYGWVATLAASVGELDIAFGLSSGDRYLWDFVTLPEFRGRGIYPRLLQTMLRAEQRDGDAERFWIIYAPENLASGAGIAKAGFQTVSHLSFGLDFNAGSQSLQADERARVGAAVLGVPLFDALQEGRVLSPCWRCVIKAKRDPSETWSCAPHHDGTPGVCTCVQASVAAR